MREDASTRNFRVVKGLFSDPILLRLHFGFLIESTLKEQIQNIQQIRSWLLDEGLFSDSPVAHCLRALPAHGNGKEFIELRNTHFDSTLRSSISDAKFAEIFPYAHDVVHYSGESDDQLYSFAALFGRVQEAIQELTVAMKKAADNLAKAQIDPYDVENSAELYHHLTSTIPRNCKEKNDRNIRLPLIDLWFEHEPLIHEWTQECCRFLEQAKQSDQKKLLLYDVHPHNTFFRGDECVLIYDFELISTWSHADVLAYGIHRFVRERIQKLLLSGHHDPIEKIPNLVGRFIDCYTEGGGPDIPENISSRLDLRIASAALVKLRTVMMRGLGVWEDPAQRNEDFQFREVDKFVKFLAEARHFKIE